MVFLKIEIFITTLQILTFWREPKFKLFKKLNVKTLIYCRRKKSWYIKIIFIDLDSFTVRYTLNKTLFFYDKFRDFI